MQYEVNNQPSGIAFECERGGVRRIVQNVHNLLMTVEGEVPYDRKRGINPRVLDQPVEDVNLVILREIDRLMNWEPRATAVSAKAELSDAGDMVITCVVDIKEEATGSNGQQ